MSRSEWTSVISSNKSLINFNIKELWDYKHLLQMFIWRDIVTEYKQTILGPIWYFIQPLLTTLMYLIVFRKFAQISTDNINPVLFYLLGIVFWNYFSEVFTKTSVTFLQNQQIFGKVYFPRLIKPLSIVFSSMLKFGIQMLLFLLIYCYFAWQHGSFQVTPYLFLFPVVLFSMASLGLGLGIIFTSATIKYRDLSYLLQFGTQLLMFATPVIYPLSKIPQKYQWFMYLNPIAHLMEASKLGFLGKGFFSWTYFLASVTCSIIILMIGVVIFNKTEKNFTDLI